ncbi:transcriptional repressor [Mycobacterium phage Aminay]|uniref:Immunity repressor n=1 Tax=Mycobacterium phage Aminay TaxID=2250291 RepID=A0A345KV32_9CAUD|nr:transcriptional repressor [Mycobacterium phage Aminay]AXH46884.1 immunity repressor [Mycobacterium phage Aminay]
MLSFLAGRRIQPHEIVEALGVSRAGYYQQRDDGRLVSADNLIRLAAVFGLNPIELLVQYGHVTEGAVSDYANGLPHPRSATTVQVGSPRRRRLRDQIRPQVDAPGI